MGKLQVVSNEAAPIGSYGHSEHCQTPNDKEWVIHVRTVNWRVNEHFNTVAQSLMV
jgi:hypothetical protein